MKAILLLAAFVVSLSNASSFAAESRPKVLFITGDYLTHTLGDETGLFNVRTDPSETNDLSAKRPILTKQLEAKWKQWDARGLAKTSNPKPAKP